MHGDGPYCYLNNPGFEPCRSFYVVRRNADLAKALEVVTECLASNKINNYKYNYNIKKKKKKKYNNNEPKSRKRNHNPQKVK